MIKKLIVASIITLISANVGHAAILFYDDAEDTYSTADWYWPPQYTGHGRNITCTTEQKRAGAKSYKFEINEPYTEANDNSHIELLLNAIKNSTGNSNFNFNQEYWIGYSIYIPSNWVSPYQPRNYGLTMQFHNSPDDCDNPSTTGVVVACQYRPENKIWRWIIGGDTAKCSQGMVIATATESPFTPGTWHDVVLNFKFDYRTANNPFFKIWVNGILIKEYNGVNCYNDARGPRFHIGIYAHMTTNPLVVYFDEVRIGDSTSSFAEVSPSGSIVYPDPVIEDLEITTTTLGTLTQGTLSSGTFAATGGSGNYLWAAIDPIPDDFVVSIDGAWTFTPALYGSYNITIAVEDGLGNTGGKIFTGTIAPSSTQDIPQVLEFTMPATSSSLTVPVTTFTADDTVNAFMITTNTAKPSKADDRWTVSAWTEATVTIDGSVTFYPWVKNSYGEVNVGVPQTVLITVDPEELPPPYVDFPEIITGTKTITIDTD